MAWRPVVYDVKESGIQNIHVNEHRDMLTDVLRIAKVAAISAAPFREGRLRRSIQINTAKPEGPDRLGGRLLANAAHARYVNDGTEDGIYAGSSQAMKVPKKMGILRGSEMDSEFTFPVGKGFKKKTVSGQKAVQFIEKGIDAGIDADPRVTRTWQRLAN